MGEPAISLTPEAVEISERALTMPEQANAIKVTDSGSYLAAGELWKNIKALRERVSDCFDPLIKHAHELHRATLAKKNEVDKPLEAAQRTVKGTMETYDREQERIRQEEERRLREIARKEEEERLLLEAIEAEAAMKASGMTAEEVKEGTAKIIEEPVYVAPVVVPKATPKVEGMSYRTTWKFRIVNPALIPREYLVPDEVKIGGVVRALKDQCRINGVQVYSERV